MIKNSTVFVTGATGFLGGWLVKRLAAEGAIVRALARRPERADFLRHLDHVEIVQGDVTDAGRMVELCTSCDVVFHVAAAFDSMQSQQKVNVEGTINVVQAAARANVQRLVHVSSIACYGADRHGTVVEEDMLVPIPNDPYSISKIAGEQAVRDITAQTGLPYSIIRPAMIYGEGSSAWTDTLFTLATRKPIFLLGNFIGDGSGHSQPIHVEDVVDLMLVLAEHPAAIGEAFNCAPDPAPTWREFLGGYAQLAGKTFGGGIPAPIVRTAADLLAALTPRDHRAQALPGVVRNHVLGDTTYSMEKAQRLLNWRAKVELQTGIVNLRAYLKNKGLLG